MAYITALSSLYIESKHLTIFTVGQVPNYHQLSSKATRENTVTFFFAEIKILQRVVQIRLYVLRYLLFVEKKITFH